MSYNPRVEQLNLSDMTRTRTLASLPLDKRPDAQEATHIIRILGLIGTGDEMDGVRKILAAGGTAAKRLLVTKLEDVVSALAAIGVTVTTTAAASSTFNGGVEINAIATWLSLEETGDAVKKNIYSTSPSSTVHHS